ncbi:MucR family transcriptional regulator [Methylorubrum populi]|uniref:MucR family transcriptional regulator n=1 Tax=Methylobacteriaceae TaxID=119045 RepID=UPI003AF89FB2
MQGLTVDVVSSYVSSHPLPSVDLPALILRVHSALSDLSALPDPEAEDLRERATPSQIRRSITPDALISFIDGRPYKTLKRHLAAHGLDIEGYRRRYGLPADYPTVAANYSAERAALAKSIGLGQSQEPEEARPPRKKVFARPGRRRKEKAA